MKRRAFIKAVGAAVTVAMIPVSLGIKPKDIKFTTLRDPMYGLYATRVIGEATINGTTYVSQYVIEDQEVDEMHYTRVKEIKQLILLEMEHASIGSMGALLI